MNDWMDVIHPPRIVITHNNRRAGHTGDWPLYWSEAIVVAHRTRNGRGVVGQLRSPRDRRNKWG